MSICVCVCFVSLLYRVIDSLIELSSVNQCKDGEQTQKTHRDKERRIKTRRRVEHEVRFKSFVWRMVKAITFGDAAPVPKPKKFQGLCEETCLEVSEDDVTLTSTTSSRNSEIMITENC